MPINRQGLRNRYHRHEPVVLAVDDWTLRFQNLMSLSQVFKNGEAVTPLPSPPLGRGVGGEGELAFDLSLRLPFTSREEPTPLWEEGQLQ